MQIMHVRSRSIICFSALVAALVGATSLPAQDSWQRTASHVTARLVARTASAAPGVPLEVGILLQVDPDWHVYWKNPGQSGLPVTVEWRLPAGWSAGPIRWPAPRLYMTGDTATYGYEGEVLLSSIVQPAGETPASGDDSVLLSASVTWLACRVECIPGRESVALDLPFRQGSPSAASAWSPAFAASDAALPSAAPEGTTAVDSGSSITLSVPDWTGQAETRFIPAAGGLIQDEKPQQVSDRSGRLQVIMPAAGLSPARLTGVLVSRAGPRVTALDVDVPVTDGPAVAAGRSGNGLLVALLLSLAGGMILNLMPCVLPVLSLKVIAIARDAGETRGRRLSHALLYTAGVVASFVALGAVIIAVRGAGRLVGWGFLFQDAGVVAVTSLVFFLVGLNLFGVFEVGTPAGAGAAASGAAGVRAPGLRALASGFFAAAVATPCTAPFMAAALGFALTQPAAAGLLVFAALGIGMALPIVLVASLPRIAGRMPRPGRWMETLRQLMGFPMMAAAVWMLSVAAALRGADAVIGIAAAMTAAGLGAWLWGRRAAAAGRGARRAALAAGTLIVGAALVFAALLPRLLPGEDSGDPSARSTSAAAAEWGTWSPARVEDLRSQGRAVLIDFTARWCLTCQVNEAGTLRNAEVLAAVRAKDVTLLRADWTDGSDEIARALSGYGRAGVPVYVLYSPGEADPVLLPELLTPRAVLAALSW
jgi:thiol:disulfide interchange protein/DsbC/DsbD-like thiol-disulfide interchange protein